MRRVVFIIVALLLSSLSVSAQNSAQPYRIPIEIQTPLSVELLDRDAVKERAEDLDHNRSDLAAQWLAATSAERMVLLSWVQLFATAATIILAYVTFTMSKKAFENDSRPVMITDTPVFPNGITVKGNHIDLDLIVNNHGKGVAYVRSYNFQLRQNSPVDKTGVNLGLVLREKMHLPIAPGRTWELRANHGAKFDIQSKLKSGIIMGSTPCYFYGEIRYMATNKKIYVHRFVYKWDSVNNGFESYPDDWWS